MGLGGTQALPGFMHPTANDFCGFFVINYKHGLLLVF
jgi:hypothetical protein